jgi:hypothetical protein
MRSILTRLATLGVAGIIAASAFAPASAATREKRTAAPAEREFTEQNVRLPARPDWAATPTPAWQAPNSCVSDEGYGRFSSCDSGTSM